MIELLRGNSFFCITLTVAAFCLASACQKKWKLAILNPILAGGGVVMLTLWAMGMTAGEYQAACAPLSYLMTPATICLGISFAEQVDRMKKHLPAILLGVAAGTVCSLGGIAAMARLMGLDQVLTASLLPKSVTTAIGVALSEQMGGLSAVTTAAIAITGVLGYVVGPVMAKLLRIREPIAKGVAFGTAAHVIGTAKAMEEDALCGAVSSLSLTMAGLLTSLVVSFLL